MNWTKFFDGIYLINLPHRIQRLVDSWLLLESYNIPFERVEATANAIGQLGLRITMLALFEKCLAEGKSRILVFEDDLQPTQTANLTGAYMNRTIIQLDGISWDVLSLGPNTHQPIEKVSDSLLIMKKCRGLHATAYSKTGMKNIVELLKNTYTDKEVHIDMLIEECMQPAGHCYCTFPLLFTQRNSFSDIKREEVDMSYIVQRFERNTRHLFMEKLD